MSDRSDGRWVLGATTALGLFLTGPILSGPELAVGGDRSVTIIEGVTEPNLPVSPPVTDTPQFATAPIRTDNPAGIHVDLLPSPILSVGTDVVFRVTTQKSGYLIIVDVNADNQMAQIYPNVMSLIRKQGKTPVTNLIALGSPIDVPNMKNPLAKFTFRTEPPLGKGVIIAILSEQPVQLIDLPELPRTVTDPQTTVDFLDKSIRSLKVSQADNPSQFDSATWSFAAVEYVVK